MSDSATQQLSPADRFPLVRMLGAGADGVSYLATDSLRGKEAVVHRLKLDAPRLAAVTQRLGRLELAKGAGMLEVVFHDVEASEPVIVVEHSGAGLALERPLSREAALTLALHLARTLSRAHRVGLNHTALAVSTVWLKDDGTPVLEFTGVDTGAVTPVAQDAQCRAPEGTSSSDADIFSLGALLSLTLTGSSPKPFDERATAFSGQNNDAALSLVKEMMDAEPALRPPADEVVTRLQHLLTHPGDEVESAAGPGSRDEEPTQLGRFKIEALIGRGSMGRVYRATDLSDGTKVALKLIDGSAATSVGALRRFRKEARLLGEVRVPFIANLIESNHDQGHHFIAVELVEGQDLHLKLLESGGLPEADAVAIAADLTRALVEVHARGIVHRDIKPSNIILLPNPEPFGPRAKLIDFGIARHVDEHASLEMTEAGAAVGTPAYMSPEACRGETLDVKSDIYSVGITLYALVAGKPPFTGDSPGAIFTQHMFQTAPALDAAKPGTSAHLSHLVARCLEKDPQKRPDAHELLDELESLSNRGSEDMTAHPLVPGRSHVITYRFEWELKSSPLKLWDYVSNTERLNRAIGMGPVEESFKSVEGDLERYGKNKSAGLNIKWLEHPYEWVHGKRLGVLREMVQGPLFWLRSAVDLEPKPGGGTHLVHTIEVEPRGVFGRAAAAVEVGVRTRLALGRVYTRIDELLVSKRDEPTQIVDAFEAPHQLEPEQEARLTTLERAMVDAGADSVCTARLGDYLRHAPAQEVARIRPLDLAKRLSLAPSALVTACFWAAKQGALTLAWDIICPACRVPSEMKGTLRALREHGRCEVCNIDYALDLASSVELVFSPHESLRPSDRRTYCLGSPGHAPHVAAQIRIAKGTLFELELSLDDGNYALAGRRLPFTVQFRVQRGAPQSRWELSLTRGPPASLCRSLASGKQVIVLENDTDDEQLVRVERAAGRDDALTAAKVASMPLFRRLFPLEVLSPGQLVNVSDVTLLMAELVDDARDEVSDGGSFTLRYALFRRLEERAALEGGAVVKLAGDGVVAVFGDVASAVRAGLALAKDPLPLRAAVHKGPAAAVTFDEHLDYFGRTVRETTKLLGHACARELLLSEAASTDAGALSLENIRGQGTIALIDGSPCQRLPLSSPVPA